MTPLEHLSVIEELVLNRATPGEIRGHLIAIRPALEAHAQMVPEHAKLKADLATMNGRYLQAVLDARHYQAALHTEPKPKSA